MRVRPRHSFKLNYSINRSFDFPHCPLSMTLAGALDDSATGNIQTLFIPLDDGDYIRVPPPQVAPSFDRLSTAAKALTASVVRVCFFPSFPVISTQQHATTGFYKTLSDAALVNEAFAHATWPNQDAIGKVFIFNNGDGKPVHFRVVGIVADIHQFGPADAPHTEVYVANHHMRNMFLVVRTTGDRSLSPIQSSSKSGRLIRTSLSVPWTAWNTCCLNG